MAALAVVPADEASGRPSGVQVLRLLPTGLVGAVTPSPPRSACLHASATVDTGGGTTAEVHLCGVCHVEPSSAEAVHDAVACRADSLGGLRAVALECDSQTLVLIRCAHAAIKGLPRERVRTEGSERVRVALHDSEEVRDLARRRGANSDGPLDLPSSISHHLSGEGALWGDEMRAAAEAAEAMGAQVHCLGAAPLEAFERRKPESNRSPPPALGLFACWLRAHELCPGLDAHSCDTSVVDACNTAMREWLPALHGELVTEPDERMAARLRLLCTQLVRTNKDDLAAGHGGAHTPPCMVAVVGAQHVPGIQRALLRRAADH